MFLNDAVLDNAVTGVARGSTNNEKKIKMTDPKKQERLELLQYLKAHFDLIAVTLVVAYVGYQLYKLGKK